jgi:UDP-3-O-[3-hydroxymyristoyl] glucosamine N-acyltransferase
MQSVVLYGSGSSLIVDVEETCRRCGLLVAAIIKNVEGDDRCLDRTKLVRLSEASPQLLSLPIIIPLFAPANRKQAWEEAKGRGAVTFATLLDPTAVLPSALDAAEGVYINSAVSLGAASRLGRFSLINRGASLGHHLILGEFASVGPGVVAAGQVTIGRGAVVGAGAVILPGIEIGENAVVAAGAVVTSNIPAQSLAAGNPARIVRREIPGYKGGSLL